MFVDVYDHWPIEGPGHLASTAACVRWVAIPAAVYSIWDTRLVVRADRLALADRPDGPAESVDVGDAPLPIVAMRGDAIEVVVWRPKAPWSAIARRGWTALGALPRGALGVLLAREEIRPLLSRSLTDETRPARDRLRLGAILGRMSDSAEWSEADVERARPPLPAVLFYRIGDPASFASRLASANADPRTDASWSGHAFRFVPLDDLP